MQWKTAQHAYRQYAAQNASNPTLTGSQRELGILKAREKLFQAPPKQLRKLQGRSPVSVSNVKQQDAPPQGKASKGKDSPQGSITNWPTKGGQLVSICKEEVGAVHRVTVTVSGHDLLGGTQPQLQW
jgi:hypothetical protein